jgi:hypothetical protein
MLLKTNDQVKKSRSRESRVQCESNVDRQFGRVFVNCPTTDYSTLKLKEQTGNVYENKGQGQEVQES